MTVEKKEFRFREWNVYKDAKVLFSDVIKIVRSLPKEYRYELGSQILRSSSSIILNIAEGSGKSSDKELNRFFDIAIGSVNETLAISDILRDNKLLSEEMFVVMFGKLRSISRQLGGFKKGLNL